MVEIDRSSIAPSSKIQYFLDIGRGLPFFPESGDGDANPVDNLRLRSGVRMFPVYLGL